MIINKIMKINVDRVLMLIENLKISFDAMDVMYINKISIPPRKIKKRE